MLFPSIETGTAMLGHLKIIFQIYAHSVHQNSVEISWTVIYRGRLFFRAEIYRGRLLTLITGSSSRLLHIRFSADLAMYWFPVCHLRCMKFKPLNFSDMDLESKYCYFYHSWEFVPYEAYESTR